MICMHNTTRHAARANIPAGREVPWNCNIPSISIAPGMSSAFRWQDVYSLHVSLFSMESVKKVSTQNLDPLDCACLEQTEFLCRARSRRKDQKLDVRPKCAISSDLNQIDLSDLPSL
jgi:hypothetical protein